MTDILSLALRHETFDTERFYDEDGEPTDKAWSSIMAHAGSVLAEGKLDHIFSRSFLSSYEDLCFSFLQGMKPTDEIVRGTLKLVDTLRELCIIATETYVYGSSGYLILQRLAHLFAALAEMVENDSSYAPLVNCMILFPTEEPLYLLVKVRKYFIRANAELWLENPNGSVTVIESVDDLPEEMIERRGEELDLSLLVPEQELALEALFDEMGGLTCRF